ncbi:hypothetical protein L1987_63551 [Smallanthus sonchifolius]|uniref:Uncharacterized protein n=1 Tax=Smallanthus sonchifolius TaxID=185202 RepID=A0ACB9CDH4_9ASTR|nr:hypothetical protein L1987_63551 [Smallanthus sonchifolius]
MPSPPPPLYFNKHGGDTPEPMIRIWAFRSQKTSGFSAMRFLGRIKAKFARALGFVSSSRSSTSSSSCNCTLKRSRSYVEALDSHRAQAIEDCIQFLNSSSSSSFQRSKSVSY